MFLEAFGAYTFYQKIEEEKKNEQFGQGCDDHSTDVVFIILVILYILLTLYVAIRFPVANNILISLLFAIFLTPVFWVLVLLQLIIGETMDNWFVEDRKRRSRRKIRARFGNGMYY